jgi:RNA polymerase sigma-70 factor (ECF subfamily)
VSRDLLWLRRPARDDPELSDEAVALACAGGDAAAIALLFDRFQRRVAAYVARLTGRAAEVDDLVQATFLEVARGRARFEAARGGVTTWLFSVATNVVRHHRRATSRWLRLRAAFARVAEPGGPDLAREVDARMQLARAERALAGLAHELREAFVLCELEGFSAADAAAVVGASEAAVWKRVSKARRALREAVLGGDR